MTRTDLTPGQLELCRLVGLLEETSPGVFRITHAGRTLLGERPPAPRVETHDEWLARVDGIRARGGRP